MIYEPWCVVLDFDRIYSGMLSVDLVCMTVLERRMNPLLVQNKSVGIYDFSPGVHDLVKYLFSFLFGV